MNRWTLLLLIVIPAVAPSCIVYHRPHPPYDHRHWFWRRHHHPRRVENGMQVDEPIGAEEQGQGDP